jgi:hypothetical protein
VAPDKLAPYFAKSKQRFDNDLNDRQKHFINICKHLANEQGYTPAEVRFFALDGDNLPVGDPLTVAQLDSTCFTFIRLGGSNALVLGIKLPYFEEPLAFGINEKGLIFAVASPNDTAEISHYSTVIERTFRREIDNRFN